jgi:sulfite exporter TauE/SafE
MLLNSEQDKSIFLRAIIDLKQNCIRKIMKIDWELLSGAIISLILADIGLVDLIRQDIYRGILFIVLAITILSFTSNISKIKENKKEIEDLKENLDNLKKEIDIQKKLLNTIKDIVLLKKK